MNTDQLRHGIDQFNNGRFFEAHDILEDLWMETGGNDKLFLQGLVQIAVGFYHFFNANFKGACSQLSKGLLKLDRYRPAHRGVELEQFTKDVAQWHAIALTGVQGTPMAYRESDVPTLSIEN